MKTILQVEDDPNDVFLFQHAMKKVGVTNPLQVASDGQQAIDYLQSTGKFADRGKFPFPCLVLLDLKLPYVMGLEVLRWIRQQLGRLCRSSCSLLPQKMQTLRRPTTWAPMVFW